MRYTPPSLRSTSHSSRAQRLSAHHSPELRQGPEAVSTVPRMPDAATCAGRSSFTCTAAGRVGRNMRKASCKGRLGYSVPATGLGGEKECTENESGRCVFNKRAEPTL